MIDLVNTRVIGRIATRPISFTKKEMNPADQGDSEQSDDPQALQAAQFWS